jgi:peptidyl-prolyl cis-trans isomerase SurA
MLNMSHIRLASPNSAARLVAIKIRTASWLALTIALSALALPAAALAQAIGGPSVKPIDSIVALVDEDIILRSELDLAVAGIVDRIRASGEAMPPMNLLESQVLERLIIRELQVQRALQTGIRISDADIDQALLGLAQQNGMTLQQLRSVIEGDGEDFAEFRRNVGEELITDTEVDILLTSEELSGGEYNLSHIQMALPEGATPQQITEVQLKADEVYQRLLDGLDFASAAISYSNTQEALEGGNVGWRDLNSIPAFMADAVRDLKPGEFTQPIRSPVGFHIVRVNDYREERQVVIEEYHARHIMIETNELVTPRVAMEEITRIKDELNQGADFAELAKKYSDDPTSANIGGDMGWFPPDAYGDRVYQTLVSMTPGEVSEPFQTTGGWHVMELLDKRQMDRTQEAIRAEAREQIRMRKADQEIERVLRQFRDEAFVEIRLPGHENSSG